MFVWERENRKVRILTNGSRVHFKVEIMFAGKQNVKCLGKKVEYLLLVGSKVSKNKAGLFC